MRSALFVRGRESEMCTYPFLERHFSTAHYACNQPTCLERKFVVFVSALDLQAHMVQEHGMKDRRVVGLEMEFASRGGGGGHQNQQGNRVTGSASQVQAQAHAHPPPPRQQPPGLPPPAPPQNQAQGGSKRKQVFSGSLTSDSTNNIASTSMTATLGPPTAGQGQGPSRRASPSAGFAAEDGTQGNSPAVDRHTSFLNLLASLAPNPTNALAAVQAAARGYRAGESSARDLIGIVWSVLERERGGGNGNGNAESVASGPSSSAYRNKDTLEPTARVINAFVDLLEDEEEGDEGSGGVDENDKRSLELLREWKGFEVEQRRQFPDLFPTAIASSSSPAGAGAGAYASITSGRVLNAKHSTHTSNTRFGRGGTSSGSALRGGQQVWERVAQAATTGISTPSGWASGGPRAVPRSAAANKANSNVPGSMAAVTARSKVDTDKFPPLGVGAAGPRSATGGVGGSTRKTPWVSGSGSGNANGSSSTSTVFPTLLPSTPSQPPSGPPASGGFRPFSVPATTSRGKSSSNSAPPPKLNPTAFPGLPTSTNKREKVQVKGNVSLRNILGTSGEAPVSKWGASPSPSSVVGAAIGSSLSSDPGTPAPASGVGTDTTDFVSELDAGAAMTGDAGAGAEPGDETVASGGAGKKVKGGKGKGKQKQTLFTLGSFPT
ncbi:hypothetical protein D9757_011667 [Collybiopsis confluens]|uniref:C2H2-type domain-containing protein n=1 Tax=Collybiopsis confluens TaxID=2823264 RepID=A0A8H5GHZ8_9AGAR|nr:hypothetical protein D9757_011667 [Collybiopsis confluens]